MDRANQAPLSPPSPPPPPPVFEAKNGLTGTTKRPQTQGYNDKLSNNDIIFVYTNILCFDCLLLMMIMA